MHFQQPVDRCLRIEQMHTPRRWVRCVWVSRWLPILLYRHCSPGLQEAMRAHRPTPTPTPRAADSPLSSFEFWRAKPSKVAYSPSGDLPFSACLCRECTRTSKQCQKGDFPSEHAQEWFSPHWLLSLRFCLCFSTAGSSIGTSKQTSTAAAAALVPLPPVCLLYKSDPLPSTVSSLVFTSRPRSWNTFILFSFSFSFNAPVTLHPKSSKMVDQATADKLEAGFAKLQAATDCKSLLKKYLTKDVFEKLKGKKTAMGATLLDVIQSGKCSAVLAPLSRSRAVAVHYISLRALYWLSTRS